MALALLAAARPTEVPAGPFVAFQQGKDALPDGRRVSNWYLLDDSGNSVSPAAQPEIPNTEFGVQIQTNTSISISRTDTSSPSAYRIVISASLSVELW